MIATPLPAYTLSTPTTAHPNDHYVTVMRTKSFLQRAQKADTEPFFILSKMSVGAYFQKDSPAIATGLKLHEVNLLLPHLLDIDPADREFRSSVAKYYTDLFTPIPPKEGLRLNIGLSEDNSKLVSSTNLPLNLVDYLRYRHILGHPQVGKSAAAASGLQQIKFYIDDATIVNAQAASLNDQIDQALSAYLTMKNHENKVDMLLTLLKVDPVTLVKARPVGERMTLKQAKLKELATSNPKEFIETMGKDNFALRYLLKSLVNAGIWVQAADAILDKGNNDIIGRNEVEAMVWMQNPKYSNRMMAYRGKLQDYMKRPPATWEEAAPTAEEIKPDLSPEQEEALEAAASAPIPPVPATEPTKQPAPKK